MSKPRPMFNRTVKLPLMLIRCVAVMASAMVLLLWFIGVLSVSLSSHAGLTVEAEPGDDVTLWCEHSLTLSSYLFWLKQINNSAPDYITFTLSDSGLYYCSTLEGKYMTFSTTTYLQIRENKGVSSKTPDESEEVGCKSDVFLMLTVVFGVVIVVQTLLMIVQCIRKQQREDSNAGVKEENEEQDGEAVNYAALHVNKRNKGSEKNVTVFTYVIYSSVSNIH
ncbi:uncharacterized protein LOC108414904 isoform X3 [Pygocentrus nattereri]|uniref:uncharacterized protein LOC108414904 isoform X3 n=1 Tax=Pygocentrus nattereri TaxID=42514 RepID=UPI0018918040|nr:uncharacterized protein LOC108414904 isoform X3 [Pygocentrus nattereri]